MNRHELISSRRWNQILPKFAEFDDEPEEEVLSFLQVLKAQNATCGLDIGCGSGRHTLAALTDGFRMAAVDYSNVAINVTRRTIARVGLVADVRRNSMGKLPFPDRQFDFAIAWCVLNHGNQQSFYSAIAEAFRVLRPGGVLLGSVMTQEDSRYGQGRRVANDCYVFTEGLEAGIAHYFPPEKDVTETIADRAEIESMTKSICQGAEIVKYHPRATSSCHLIFVARNTMN